MRLPGIAIGLSLALCVSAVHAPVRAEDPRADDAPQASESDRPHRTWKRATSNNFVAVGDASEAALHDALTELEVFRSAMFSLSSVLPAPRFTRSTPLMVLFRNDATFGPYRPRTPDGGRRNDVVGYYMRATWGAHMLTAADGDRVLYQLPTVLHEYAHDIFHNTLGTRLPHWLDEGLAELCGSVGAAGENRVVGRLLGRPLDWHVTSVRRAELPRIADLLAIDSAKLMVMNVDETRRFYSKSWALVHYLLLGRADRRPSDVPAFIAALEAGQTPEEAFQRAFRINMTEIDAALASYVGRVSFPAIRIEDTTAVLRRITTEPMLESEVAQLQGQILSHVGDMAGAETRLLDALARNPASAATRVALADLRLAEGRAHDAIELAGPVAAADPSNAVALISLGLAQQRARQFREALESFTAATDLDLTEASAPAAWYGRSLAARSLDMLEESANAMARLQSLSRSSSWLHARARDLWIAGLDAPAIADAESLRASPDVSTSDRSYASFVGALAARRLNRPDVASDLLTRSASPDDTPWTSTVRAYLLGTLTDREFLGRADGRGEQTEARAYVGLSASLAGRLDEAREHLTWVRDRGSRAYSEFDMARVELARLDGR